MNLRLTVIVLAVAVAACAVAIVMKPGDVAPVSAPSASTALVPIADSRGSDPLRVAFDLRTQGHFEAAIKILRDEYQRSKNPEALRQMLGVVEDTGRAADQVTEARAFLALYPKDRYGEWMLARGLNFEVASTPSDPKNGERMAEAAAIAERLQKAGYQPPGMGGAVTILGMQLAFLKHRWADTDALAGQALKEGPTSGESADILSLRFLMSLLAANLPEAENRLGEIQRKVDSYAAGRPNYYMLRGYREELLVVRAIFFDKPFTAADIDRLAAVHAELRKQNLIDPTLPADDEVAKTQEAMREWLRLADKGNLAGQYALVERGLAEDRAWKPRCFYSEALERPFRPFYHHVLAGDLARKMGDKAAARSHYQAALEIFPDDRLLEQRLATVR
jgi:hypothetical protein